MSYNFSHIHKWTNTKDMLFVSFFGKKKNWLYLLLPKISWISNLKKKTRLSNNWLGEYTRKRKNSFDKLIIDNIFGIYVYFFIGDILGNKFTYIHFFFTCNMIYNFMYLINYCNIQYLQTIMYKKRRNFLVLSKTINILC